MFLGVGEDLYRDIDPHDCALLTAAPNVCFKHRSAGPCNLLYENLVSINQLAQQLQLLIVDWQELCHAV